MHAMHAFRTLVALCLYVRLLEKKVQPVWLGLSPFSREGGERDERVSRSRDRESDRLV